MWQPEAGWERLPGGIAAGTVGLWSATVGGRPAVVKRLRRPGADDPAELHDPSHPAWWRREAEVAARGLVARTPGLRAPETLRVDDDEEGTTLVVAAVEPRPAGGLHGAAALGRFAGADLPPGLPGLAQHQLRRRLESVARRGGWRLLERTTVADVSSHLWSRREHLLARLDALPPVPQHGDPVPANLLGAAGEGAARAVVAVDWASLGHGPLGGDLGYWSLSAREELEPLLAAYADALPPPVVEAAGGPAAAVAGAGLAARVVAVFTVLTRADWALARVAEGEGALAGKFRHPGVAPHLRALARQSAHVEALLTA